MLFYIYETVLKQNLNYFYAESFWLSVTQRCTREKKKMLSSFRNSHRNFVPEELKEKNWSELQHALEICFFLLLVMKKSSEKKIYPPIF